MNVSVNTGASIGSITYPNATSWECLLSSLAVGDNSVTVTATDTAGNSASVTRIITVTAIRPTLSVIFSGTGTGTVTSNPSGLACNTSSSADFAGGADVTLHAAPAQYSYFTGWSNGVCSGTADCLIRLNADTSVTAVFNKDIVHQTRVDGGTTTYYSSIQEAYDAVATDTVLKLWGVEMNEDISFNRPITITMQGGYNSDYSARTGETVISGIVTVVDGTVIVDGLSIR